MVGSKEVLVALGGCGLAGIGLKWDEYTRHELDSIVQCPCKFCKIVRHPLFPVTYLGKMNRAQ